MNDRNKPRPRREGSGTSSGGRSRSEFRSAAAPRGASADELLDIADDLEAQGRALISQARKLQRLAESAGSGDREERPRPQRPGPRAEGREERPRSSRPGGSGGGGGRPGARKAPARGPREERDPGDAPRERGGPSGRTPRGDQRPKKRSSNAPDWAPQHKRKRS